MTPETSQILESFVPVYDTVPENWEDARQFLVEHLKKISNAVNIREIGWFLDEEVLAGKLFIPSSTNTTGEMQQFRTVLRKVVDCGTLPNAGVKDIPHGITVDNNFTLIQIFGATSKPNDNFLPLPFVEVLNPTGDIQLYMDTVNIKIVTSTDRTAYTRTFVTIEYIQEL